MAKYLVHIDVTFSGDVEVMADTEEQAKALAELSVSVPSDIRNFYLFDKQVVDIEEVED